MRTNSELVTDEIFSRKSETPGDPGSFRGWPAYSRSLARSGLCCSSQPSQPNSGSNSESQAETARQAMKIAPRLINRRNGFSFRILRAMPNALAVFVHFPDAMKRHTMGLALRIAETERVRVVFGEIHFQKRDDNDPALYALEVAQLKVPAAKLGVPADAVQQFVNGGHAHGHH